MTLKQFVFATKNKHKIQEVAAMLPAHFSIISLSDIGCDEELPETQNTIEGNSLQKAIYVFEKYGVDCFSEDSGLEVFSLNNEPGVHSAYYSGSRNADANMKLLLQKLKFETNRDAQFKTVFTLKTANALEQFTGIVTGKIAELPQGTAGFGYDPIFIPNGSIITFAQMQPFEKNTFSHRSKAFQLLTLYIESNF